MRCLPAAPRQTTHKKFTMESAAECTIWSKDLRAEFADIATGVLTCRRESTLAAHYSDYFRIN
jgi:hypothetical protein